MSHLIMLLQQYGLGLVFVNVLALQAGLPVPAYPVLIVAGAYAAMGGSPLWQLVAVGVAAALIADTGWYLAGRRFGLSILRTLCRVSLSPDTCVRQTESMFQRFGPTSMVFAKFIPGFASVATALAGAIRLRYWVFLLFDAVGAALWVSVGVALGYLFRNAVDDAMNTLKALGQVGLALVVAGFVAWVLIKWFRRHIFIRQLRMDRVSVDELHSLMEANKVNAIVDVRSPMTQAVTGRIPGARAIDMQKIVESFKGVPVDGEVVVYCACPNEATAVKVAQSLRKLGYKRIRPLQGGIDAWIDAAPAAIGPYSQAIRAGSTVYLSGQIGLDPVTGNLREGVDAQARQVVANLKAVAEAAGGSLDDIVKVTLLLADMADFTTVNEILAKSFSPPYPARATYQVAALPKGARVEIEGVLILRPVAAQTAPGGRSFFDDSKGQ
jgi:reactive intermediate/imine deaminase